MADKPVFTLDPAQATYDHMYQMPSQEPVEPERGRAPVYTGDFFDRTQAMFDRQRASRRDRRMTYFTKQAI